MPLLPGEESTLVGYYNPQLVYYIFISNIVNEKLVAGARIILLASQRFIFHC